MSRPRFTPSAALLAFTLLLVPSVPTSDVPRPPTARAAPATVRKYNRPWAEMKRLGLPQILVNIPVNGTVNGTPGQGLGNIDAGMNANCMTATFTLAPAAALLCEWYDFHWIQVIESDDCPAEIAGVVQPFSQLDPPAYGWDYMYDDTDVNPGIGAGDRNPGGAAPAASDNDYADDIEDTDPWYHTASEEDSDFDMCNTYPINDCPGYCDPPGKIEFSTYLVATPKYGSGKLICILAGFHWVLDNRVGHANVPPAALTIDEIERQNVQQALGHGNMPGWTASDDCDLTCQPIDLRPQIYRVDPSSEQEVPPTESFGLGYGRVVIDTEHNTMSIGYSLGGLHANVIGAELHGFARPGRTGPLLTNLPTGTTVLTTWNYSEFLEPMILDGQTYLDIKTGLYPGGEIRGQIVNATPSTLGVTLVPGLTGWRLVALIGALALGGLWMVSRRRREREEAA